MTSLSSKGKRQTWTPQRRQDVSLHIGANMVLKVLLVAALFYAAVQMVVGLAPFFLTLVVAAFLAVAADPVVRMIERRGLGRGAAVGVLMLAILAVLAAMVAIFVPPLADQGQNLVNRAPTIVNDVRTNGAYRDIDQKLHVVDRATAQLEQLPAKVSRQLGTVVGAVLAGVFGTITILFLMVLLLMGGGTLVEGAVKLFPQLAERRWWEIVQGAYRSIGAYVAGTILIAFIAGLTMASTLAILGVPYFLPLGLWMMLLGIVPLIGASIGAVPAVIVAFAVGPWWKGVAVLVVVLVYQQVENIFIQPRIQGKVVSLPPLMIFMSVLIGSQLMGVLGALFAVPVAGIVQILYRQYIESTGGEHIELPPIAPDEAPPPPDLDDNPGQVPEPVG